VLLFQKKHYLCKTIANIGRNGDINNMATKKKNFLKTGYEEDTDYQRA
jgi:hypothetical protein